MHIYIYKKHIHPSNSITYSSKNWEFKQFWPFYLCHLSGKWDFGVLKLGWEIRGILASMQLRSLNFSKVYQDFAPSEQGHTSLREGRQDRRSNLFWNIILSKDPLSIALELDDDSRARFCVQRLGAFNIFFLPRCCSYGAGPLALIETLEGSNFE